MIGKNLRKINVTISLNVWCAKKEKNISCLRFLKWLKSWKTSYSFNDSKRRKMALSCSKKSYQHYHKE